MDDMLIELLIQLIGNHGSMVMVVDDVDALERTCCQQGVSKLMNTCIGSVIALLDVCMCMLGAGKVPCSILTNP